MQFYLTDVSTTGFLAGTEPLFEELVELFDQPLDVLPLPEEPLSEGLLIFLVAILMFNIAEIFSFEISFVPLLFRSLITTHF